MFGRYKFIHQPIATRLSSIEQPSGKQQVACDLVAHLPDENRGNNRGHKPDFHFGISELRLRDRQCEVAHRRQSRATGDGGSVDSGNGRLGKFIKPPEDASHAGRILYVIIVRLA